MRRGTIAHNAMKYLWEGLGTSAALNKATSDGAIEGIITRAVDSAFEGIRVDAPLSGRYLEIGKKRLIGVIAEWLGNSPGEVMDRFNDMVADKRGYQEMRR